MESLPLSGVGLGLRFDHFADILDNPTETPWFEVITDDFISLGPHHDNLLKLREQKPIAFHSVGLNIGGVGEFNSVQLKKFKELYEKYQPELISDHLCWSEHGGRYHHDLLPIVKTKKALENVCSRIHFLQDFFHREICLENITSYIDFKNEDFDEIEFLKMLVEKTGCHLLLDISNVLINHQNRKKDPTEYFKKFPVEAVRQVHLAGGKFDEDTGFIIDSHSESVGAEDIRWLQKLREQRLSAPTLIERDADVPPFSVLEEERITVERIFNEV